VKIMVRVSTSDIKETGILVVKVKVEVSVVKAKVID
jgi:hypothetical protein